MANLKKLIFCLKMFLEKRRFKKNREYQVELYHYIELFAKKGRKPQPYFYTIRRNHNNYLQRWHWEGNKSGSVDVWVEEGYSFILIEVSNPTNNLLRLETGIACVTFTINGRAVFIKQIQGLSGQQKELKSFKWERLLVRIVVDWAKSFDFQKVKILQAQQNRYFHPEKKEDPEWKGWHDRFKIRYNTTAERLGFKFNSEEDAYVLDLC